MGEFIDANVIVKAFTENEEAKACRDALQNDFVTTMLCLVEAQHIISRITKDKVYASNSVKSLLRGSGAILDLDRNLLFETLKRIEKYNLSIFDLVSYVASLLNNCSEFISYDKDFDGLEIKRVEP